MAKLRKLLAACVLTAASAISASAAPDALAKPTRNPQAENATNQPNISGIWLIENYIFNTRPQAERLMKTIEGTAPPMQPWAAKLYHDRANETDAGRPFAPTPARCLPGGMPAMMFGAPYAFQVIQSPGQVTTIHMEQHAFRLIYLDEALPEDPDPTFMGTSIGHWDGDTLVVDTIGLTDRTTIDFSGLPHTDKLRISERIRRISPTQLEDILTFDDPGAFTKAWSARRTYKLQPPGERLLEYICETQHNPVDENGQSTYTVPK